MNNDQIQQIALANGFKLKEQPDGSMALNPYVFDFAKTLLFEAKLPPRPESGEFVNTPTLSRWGIMWQGPENPICVPMNDGYWTPWHLAEKEIDTLKAENGQLRQDAERYQHIRANFNRLQCVNPNHAPEPGKLDKAIDAELKEKK